MGPNVNPPGSRPNSGTRSTRQETAFQWHSGAAGPPTGMVVLWWQFVVAIQARDVQFAGIGHRRCSASVGISSVACAFHRGVMKLDNTLTLAVYIL